MEKCKKPQSLAEVAVTLNWKHRTKFRKKFIHPLLAEKLIKMTIPDKPQSPNQQYVITGDGKEILQVLKKKTDK